MLLSLKKRRDLKAFVKKYRTMIFLNSLFFYFGCAVTLSVIKMDCVDASSRAETESSELNNVEYVILILSAPDNILRRDAIRATWIRLGANIFTNNGERLYKWNRNVTTGRTQDFTSINFVIATKNLDDDKVSELISEQDRTKDIMLLPDVKDGYTSLSEKMLSAFKMVNKHFKNLKYVIKCDDDSFVRIDLIIKELDAFVPLYYTPEQDDSISYKETYKSLPNYKGVYWGYFNGRAKVYLSGKWKEQDWFLCDNYLPYALGGGYVISKSIVEYVARNSHFLSKYNSEDVSMGVWTAALDGINRIHDTRFDTEWKSRGCSDNMLVRHKQTPEDLHQMYKNLIHSSGQKLCSTQTVARKSYLYKWDVLPSQCCR